MLIDNTPRHVARTAPRILFSSKESIASRLARKEVDRGRHVLSGYRATGWLRCVLAVGARSKARLEAPLLLTALQRPPQVAAAHK
jgi:hypothetical protein